MLSDTYEQTLKKFETVYRRRCVLTHSLESDSFSDGYISRILDPIIQEQNDLLAKLRRMESAAASKAFNAYLFRGGPYPNHSTLCYILNTKYLHGRKHEYERQS